MSALTIRRIAGCLGFLLLFLVLLHSAGAALMHKQIEGKWNMTAKITGFYNESPNQFDVMFFGSSHMYCSVDPALLNRQTGIQSYIFATQKQPLWTTYYYIKEALKQQRPKLIVVEINMAAEPNPYLDEGTNHTAIDPIPFSFNKLQMIWAAAPRGERRFYVFPIMKYHNRWAELTKEDYARPYQKETDPEKGYVRLSTTDTTLVRPDIRQVTDQTPLNERSRQYLKKIIGLAEEHNIQLILLKTPSNTLPEEARCYNAVAELAQATETIYLNCNTGDYYEQIGLNLRSDFYDRRHLNVNGGEKFTRWFGEYLKKQI